MAYTIRPEDVVIEPQISKFPNTISAKYVGSLYRGQEVEYVFQLPDKTEFKVFKVGKQIVDLKAEIGDKVILGWESSKAVILDR